MCIDYVHFWRLDIWCFMYLLVSVLHKKTEVFFSYIRSIYSRNLYVINTLGKTTSLIKCFIMKIQR